MSTEPTPIWAVLQDDRRLGEKRVVAVYSNATDANVDAIALSNATSFVTVEPWALHNRPQWSHAPEPALEQDATDFDIPIHVDGEVVEA